MHIHINQLIGLFLRLVIILALTRQDATLALSIPKSWPPVFRSEGRVTLSVVQNNLTITHQLAFTESIDSIRGKSVLSIGYPGEQPKKYYLRRNSQTLTLNSMGYCEPISDESIFVPELQWFMDFLLPKANLMQFLGASEHLSGPTGLMKLFLDMEPAGDQMEADPKGIIYHRNIPCNLYSININLSKQSVKFELFVPASGVRFRNTKTTFFSVRISSPNEYLPALIIDYFNIDGLADGENPKLGRMRSDFNLPSNAGCSEYLQRFQPLVLFQSFTMNYIQRSSSSPVLIAYDHNSNYMMKEIRGKSVSIWDLNEDLLYHKDANISKLMRDQSFRGAIEPCTVLKVVDSKLSPAFKPYKTVGESMNILELIGATEIAFIGASTVRDLPCLIYEAVLEEPPVIFALSSEQLLRTSSEKRDYIIKFEILEGDDTSQQSELFVPKSGFWPARISLYRRLHDSGTPEYIDQLEVFDFYSSLEGWQKKSAQLFMASECFNDEDEQLRLELALTFEDSSKAEQKSMLRNDKFRLEFELLSEMFQVLRVSKMHLIEYQLKLRPHQVNLEMIIGDRRGASELTYFGLADQPDLLNYPESYVQLPGTTEEDCVSLASLVSDVTLVYYCPRMYYFIEIPQCVAIFVQQPTIKNAVTSRQPCQVYQFAVAPEPERATEMITRRAAELRNYQFRFQPGLLEHAQPIIIGTIKDFSVSHTTKLISINHKTFQREDANQTEPDKGQAKVRSLEVGLATNDAADCSKLCNLDVTCKSYSYCAKTTQGNNSSCLVSTLDLRSSSVADQLVHSASNATFGRQQVTVKDSSGRSFELLLHDGCSIYERNYLEMFRQTDELIRLDMNTASQFQTAQSAFECAKRSVDLEMRTPDHHVAIFAYCPSSYTCLFDENLFDSSSSSPASSADEDDDRAVSDELQCRLYRKKYQTYFKVSTKVLKQSPDVQVQVELNTVEECARACWNPYGPVCRSFDFCSTGGCLINKLAGQSEGAELEIRQGCLHYDRDLELDELRRQHLIGRHEVLNPPIEEGLSYSRIVLNLFTGLLVIGGFIYGLVLGRQVNDKMEAVTILRQSESTDSASFGRRASQMFGFLGFPSTSRLRNSSHDILDEEEEEEEDDDVDMEGYQESSGIRMGVIKSNASA